MVIKNKEFKNVLTVVLISALMLPLSGCSLGSVIEGITGVSHVGDTVPDKTTESQTDAASSDNKRVYMDEINGTLMDFTGDQLRIRSEDEIDYTFDISGASIECTRGMVTGDSICVIYEGKLSDALRDTGSVTAIKVVDDIRGQAPLIDRSVMGTIVSITPNTITLTTDSGNTATYPITGVTQYYSEGLSAGTLAYIHFMGAFSENSSADTGQYDGSHLKVLSVSDIDPMVIPEITPAASFTKTTIEDTVSSDSDEQMLWARIMGLSNNILTVQVETTQATLNVDLSGIPTTFKGGACIGSMVTIYYSGTFDGSTTSTITISSVVGEDPESANSRSSFSVSGTVVSTTANTVTIRSDDNAEITFNRASAKDYSTSYLEAGSGVKITFDPTASKETNILKATKIQD